MDCQKRKPGPPRLPDSAVTPQAIRARRARERKALERAGAPAGPAGPGTCAVCGRPEAVNYASALFDSGMVCGLSVARHGLDLSTNEQFAALSAGHTLGEIEAALAASDEGVA